MSCYKKATRPVQNTECIVEGDGLVTNLYIGEIGKPLVLPTALNQNETDESRLLRALALRLPENAAEAIYNVEIYEGTIPVASPTFRTNPKTKRQTATNTMYKLVWTEWDDSQPFYTWLQSMTGSTSIDTQPLPFLFWAVQGNNLIGGLNGYIGSMTALPSVENGGETPGRIACEVQWNVKGMMYDRLKLS